MEEYAGRGLCQLAWSYVYRGRPVPDLRRDGHRLLDGWLVIREPVVRGRADDVCSAVLQPLFLQYDGQNLPGPDDHGPDIYHDSDLKHGDLFTALGWKTGVTNPRHQTVRPTRPALN